MPGAGAGAGQALGQRRHPGGRLERVLRRDQPPDLVEGQTPQGLAAELQVPLVGRVEGATQQADPPPRRRQVAAKRGGEDGDSLLPTAQGRTCPRPRTTYL